MKPREVSIVVNGQIREVVLPFTVAQLLDDMGFKCTQVVVERNGEVLPRAQLPGVFLDEDDRLELIIPVAGG
jgi:thiamine biosynthesis protein ThiS